MRKFTIYVLVLFFTSCTKKESVERNANHNNILNQHLIEKDSISGNEYIYFFKKVKSDSSKNEYCKLDSLVISKGGKKYTLNLLNKNIQLNVDAIKGGVFAHDDYNFDGVNDIVLNPYVKTISVYGNDNRAHYFLYNKEKNMFENNIQLDNMSNLNICKKSKCLTAGDGTSTLSKYYWKADSLKILETVDETKLESDDFKIKIFDAKNNKQKEYISSKSFVSNFQCE